VPEANAPRNVEPGVPKEGFERVDTNVIMPSGKLWTQMASAVIRPMFLCAFPLSRVCVCGRVSCCVRMRVRSCVVCLCVESYVAL